MLPAQGREIQTWTYQLQSYEATSLVAAPVDLMVVDADELERSGIGPEALRQHGAIVLSYLSVGEAESYRDYWQPTWHARAPDWIGAANPDWRDNYPVKFWRGAWREIMRTQIRRIASAGFDGVYLDTIDTYEHYERNGFLSARWHMAKLVIELAGEARRIRPDFLVVAQNATELLDEPSYRGAIDGIASEDTFFHGETRQPSAQVSDVVRHLEEAKAAGLFVLTVEYGNRAATIHRWCDRALRAGFAPLVARRGLDAPRSASPQCRWTREVATSAP